MQLTEFNAKAKNKYSYKEKNIHTNQQTVFLLLFLGFSMKNDEIT